MNYYPEICLDFKDTISNHIKQCKTCCIDANLRREYGINIAQYNQIFDKQKGQCFGCHSLPTIQRLCVDHCHKTGRVRGLLCSTCNTILGQTKDREENLILGISVVSKEKRKLKMSWQTAKNLIAYLRQ